MSRAPQTPLKMRASSAVGLSDSRRMLLLSQAVGYFPYVLGATIAWGAVVDGDGSIDSDFPVLVRADQDLAEPGVHSGNFAFPSSVDGTPRFSGKWFRSRLTRLDAVEGAGISKWPFVEKMQAAGVRPCAVIAVGTPDSCGVLICIALRPGQTMFGESEWQTLSAMIPFFETLWQIECRLASGLEAQLESPLTEREEEVARLVGRGLTNGQIAAKLGIAEGTVKAHLNRVFKKFRINTRTELAVLLAQRS